MSEGQAVAGAAVQDGRRNVLLGGCDDHRHA